MIPRWAYLLVIVALVAGGILAALGDTDSQVDLTGPLAAWGSLVRDVDQLGLKVTRVSDAEEMRAGRALAATVSGSGNADGEWSSYVRAVGHALTPRVRRKGIEYTFVVIEAPEVNAFALPGGHVFVTTGLLTFVETEAELAVVLGHEVAHVDLRHCIEQYQYRIGLERAGVTAMPAELMVDAGRWLITAAYSQGQELEADAQGLRMAVQAGYDPAAGAAVFAQLAVADGEQPRARERTPVGEVTVALGGIVSAYFQSHPRSLERIARLDRFVERNDRVLSGGEYYVGRQNHARKVPRARQEFVGERRRMT